MGKKYYKGLLTEQWQEFELQEPQIQVEGEEIVITEQQVQEEIGKLKNRKASVPGGIVAELIRNGTLKLVRMMTHLFNRDEIPEEWKIGYMSSIHKKGDIRKCENYRGITVTSTFSRLYGRIIKNLIEQEY
jgi:hypothetical protein